ncbi:MAG: hypothetical protein OHK0029_20770 [Armatimonadaceae bacterium]
MTKPLRFAVLFLLLCLPVSALADPVDDLVREALKENDIPGAAVAVLRDGKVVKMAGYGLADVENRVSVTPDTVFQLGSVGKQFTAAAVLLLESDGKLSVYDTVSKYLPYAPAAWKEITVRNLLTHTSGIPDYTPLVDLTRDQSAEETAKQVAAKPLDFAPGTKWDYSNTNYLLLGEIIEKASGKFYGDFLRERIFAPLEMTTARVNSDQDIIPRRASGYEFTRNGTLKNQAYVAPQINTYADGSLVMSVRDLAKWAAALEGEKLFTAAQKRTLWTPATLTDGTRTEYGYGWEVRRYNDRPVISHAGAWQGFVSYIARYPEDKLTVLVLLNRADVRLPLGPQIAGVYVPALKPGAAKPAAVYQDPAVIGLIREVITELASDQVKQERFTPDLWKLIQPEKKSPVVAVLKQLGPPREVEIQKVRRIGDEQNYQVEVRFRTQTVRCLIAIAPDNKIAGLLFTR